MSQVTSEWLKILLKEVAINKMDMSQVLSETKAGISLLNYVMLTNMQRSTSDYVATVMELKDNLLFESKLADREQKLDREMLTKALRKHWWQQYLGQHLE